MEMCGRFTSLLSAEILENTFGVQAPPAFPPRYNIAPTQQVWTIRETAAAGRHLSAARWGLVPHWAKDLSIGSRMINARCETIHEKAAFRQAIRARRCIVPASGCDMKVACVIVRQSHLTGPAVPSAVLYEVWRRGNKSSKSPRTM